jgi:hypothetical protein
VVLVVLVLVVLVVLVLVVVVVGAVVVLVVGAVVVVVVLGALVVETGTVVVVVTEVAAVAVPKAARATDVAMPRAKPSRPRCWARCRTCLLRIEGYIGASGREPLAETSPGVLDTSFLVSRASFRRKPGPPGVRAALSL